jgi:hypothetical protein
MVGMQARTANQEEVGHVLKGAPDNVPTSFENAVPVRLDDCEYPRQLRDKQFIDGRYL